MADFDEKLRAAREASRALHADTDKLNEALRDLEDKLTRLHLGVSAVVPFSTDAEETRGRDLWFRKEAGAWRFVVTSPFGVEMLSHTAREMRFRAVDVLEDLIVALFVEAENEALEAVEKLAAVRRLSAKLDARLAETDRA